MAGMALHQEMLKKLPKPIDNLRIDTKLANFCVTVIYKYHTEADMVHLSRNKRDF